MTGRQLQRAIKDCGLTYREAAKHLGIAHTTLWRQIRGDLPVSGPIEAAVSAWVLLHERHDPR